MSSDMTYIVKANRDQTVETIVESFKKISQIQTEIELVDKVSEIKIKLKQIS